MKGTLFPAVALAAIAAVILAAPPAAAQAAGDADLARRTFLNAQQLLREGKDEQAMRDLQQVVQAFPESEYVDDALILLGSHDYPAESLSQLGMADRRAQEAARPYFEQVRERYPQSDKAPLALYKLGLLSLEPSSGKRSLDEAYASFSRVVNIYPKSAWVGRAYLGAAFSELGKHSYDRAILAVERALEASYGEPVSAEAHYFLGVCNARLGEIERAAEAFQRCRDADPDSGFAEPALEWLTLIYRTRLQPAAGQEPRHNPVTGFVPRVPAGEDLRGDLDLAVSPRGDLVVADPKQGTVLTFGRDGALKGTEAFPGAARVAFDAFGNLMVAGEESLKVADQRLAPGRSEGGRVRPVEEIAGLWRAPDRTLWILDAKEGELLRYAGDINRPQVVINDKAAGTRMRAMAVGPEGRIFVVDGKKKALLRLDNGALHPLAPEGKAVELESPVDLAADALGNLYVLDEKRRAVIVLNPDGSRLAVISPPESSPQALEGPGSVAVGPAGEVYVYDKRKRTILQFD